MSCFRSFSCMGVGWVLWFQVLIGGTVKHTSSVQPYHAWCHGARLCLVRCLTCWKPSLQNLSFWTDIIKYYMVKCCILTNFWNGDFCNNIFSRFCSLRILLAKKCWNWIKDFKWMLKKQKLNREVVMVAKLITKLTCGKLKWITLFLAWFMINLLILVCNMTKAYGLLGS